MVAETLEQLLLFDRELIWWFQLRKGRVEVASQSIWFFLLLVFSDDVSFAKLICCFLDNLVRFHFTLVLHTQESFINFELKLGPPLVFVVFSTGKCVGDLVISTFLRLLWKIFYLFGHFVIFFIGIDHAEIQNALLKKINESGTSHAPIKGIWCRVSRSSVVGRVDAHRLCGYTLTHL